MRPYRTKETVGKIGENALLTWADEVGLVVNSSGDDRAGWDFLLESAPEAGDEPPASPFLHNDAFPLRARVQVKATDKSEGFIDVKLSNWLRLVEDPNPAFFFVTELGGHRAPQRAFLFHVDEPYWRSVLERKRRNEVGERKPLHKLRLRLHYADGHELARLDGQALLCAISDAVGSSGSAYAERKAQAVQRLGFEEGNASVKVVFPDDDGEGAQHPVVQLADLEIGLKQNVPFSRAEVHGKRFGILDESPVFVIQEGSIVAPPPSPRASVDVRFAAPMLGQEVRFAAEFYAPTALAAAIRAGKSPDEFPVRVTTPFFEAVVRWGGNSTIRYFTPEPDDAIPARNLNLVARLISIHAQAAQAEADVEVEFLHEGCRIVLLSGTLPAPADGAALTDHLAFCDLIETTWGLFRTFEADDRAHICTTELTERAEAVESLAAFVDGHLGGTLTFGWDPPEDSVGLALTDHARDTVLSLELILGSERLTAAAHLEGELTLDDSQESGYRVDYTGTDYRTLHAARTTESPPEIGFVAMSTVRKLGRKAIIINSPLAPLAEAITSDA